MPYFCSESKIMLNEPFLSREYLGNPVSSFALLALILLVGLLFKKVLSIYLSRLLFKLFKDFSKGVDRKDFENLLFRPVSNLLFLIFIFIGFDQLKFPPDWNLAGEEHFGLRMLLMRTYKVFVICMITWVLLRILDFLAIVLIRNQSEALEKWGEHIIIYGRDTSKVIVCLFAFFILLGVVFNVNVGSIVAGLGLSGLAIALAAKETLENLLGSFTLFIDKPFVVGDFVKAGNITGFVEKIGFRSTRIRTLEKSLVTIPNKKMADAETENLTSRYARRADITLVLDFRNSVEVLEAILGDIRTIVKTNPMIDQGDVTTRFLNFGKDGFEIRVDVYFMVRSNEDFFGLKEALNLAVLKTIQQRNGTFFIPNTPHA